MSEHTVALPAPPPPKRIKLAPIDPDDYICRANDVLSMHFVSSPEQIVSAESQSATIRTTGFSPEFTHQIYGQEEQIIGFKALKLAVGYSVTDLRCYVGWSCEDQLQSMGSVRKEKDAIAKLREWLPEGHTSSSEEFAKILEEEKTTPFRPPGIQVHSYTHEDGNQYVVHRTEPCRDPPARELHERAESIAIWYIDGASAVDLHDHRWTIYTVYRKSSIPNDSRARYEYVGYLTTFSFMNPFRKQAPVTWRICQVLILPPFRRMGHAKRLIRLIAQQAEQNGIYEVNVNDPTDTFRSLFELVCLERCVKSSGIFNFAVDSGPELEKAKSLLRVRKEQVLRCYQILKLKAVMNGGSEDDKRALQKEFKERIFDSFRADLNQIEDKGELEKALQVLYDQVIEEFQGVIGRLDSQRECTDDLRL